jgi:hypothetical protein
MSSVSLGNSSKAHLSYEELQHNTVFNIDDPIIERDSAPLAAAGQPQNRAAPAEPVKMTPLPKKQFIILCAITLAEPIQLTILFPFVFFM